MRKEESGKKVSNDGNQVEFIRMSEEIIEDTLDEIKGGIDGIAEKCCGVQLFCNSKNRSDTLSPDSNAELSVQ